MCSPTVMSASMSKESGPEDAGSERCSVDTPTVVSGTEFSFSWESGWTGVLRPGSEEASSQPVNKLVKSSVSRSSL